jgi:hypothetical protein
VGAVAFRCEKRNGSWRGPPAGDRRRALGKGKRKGGCAAMKG